MKKKKTGAGIFLFLLIIGILASYVTAFAAADPWNSFGGSESPFTFTRIVANEYIDTPSIYQNGLKVFTTMLIPKEDAAPDDYLLTLHFDMKNSSTSIAGGETWVPQKNYYAPQMLDSTYKVNYRQCEVPLCFIATDIPYKYDKSTGRYNMGLTDAEIQALADIGDDYIASLCSLKAMAASIADTKAVVGGYHPVYADFLNEVVRCINVTLVGSSFGWTDPGDVNVPANTFLTNKCCLRADQIQKIIDEVVPFYKDYVEKNRISSPDFTSFSVGGSYGLIDKENATITVRLPEGTDLSAAAVEMSTNHWTEAKLKSGSVSSGSAVYTVTAYEGTTGIRYNNATYGYIQKDWTIKIVTGEPYVRATSFAVEDGNGTMRYADIDEENAKIVLNMPFGTDLSSLSPVIEHTGTKNSLASGAIDFSDSVKNPIKLTIKNETFDLEKVYDVTITANKSANCNIDKYVVSGVAGVIGENTITVTMPYGTVLPAAASTVEISEFASLTSAAPALAYDTPLSYTVTAEAGNTKTYTVTIMQEAVSTGNDVLEFSCGSKTAVIDQNDRTIVLTLPVGTDVTALAPSVSVSENASVSPSSGEAKDFSGGSPVTYTVTSQNGVQKAYAVTVLFESVDNPYVDRLRTLREGMISRYKAIDDGEDHDGSVVFNDWELLCLGMYEGQRLVPGDEMPYGFDIYDTVAETDIKIMTDLDRAVMALTSLGINCTDLSKYGDGTAFKIKGATGGYTEINNLVEAIYNFSGSSTINGPIFALIALDMGSYSIPENAVWTRENLLETILNHTYGTDNFDVDMVGMLMYSIAPYQNDAVYGERVRAKLNEGLALVLGEKTAAGVHPMSSDYSFNSWGAINNESAAQVYCAMSAMGIDVGVDTRFNNDTTGTLDYWLTHFAMEDNTGFGHASTNHDVMGTYEACYTIQWYLGFLDDGGAGHPYSPWYHMFDFSHRLSGEASVTAFELEGKQGVITEATTEGGRNTISVTLPAGMPLTNMTPTLTLSEGATLFAPNLPLTFTAGVPQPFTVLAEDGATQKVYYVTVTLDSSLLASGTAMDLASIKLQDSLLNDKDILKKKVTENAETGSTDVLLTVDAGTDVTKLHLSADVSYGATVSPSLAGTAAMDLSDWTVFTITAQDSTEAAPNRRIYRIKVQAAAQASIAAFTLTIGGTAYNGVIDNNANTITVSGVDDSALTSTTFAPNIEYGEGTTSCSPAPGLEQDFSVAVTYTVSGNNIVARAYAVSVLNKSGKLISAGGGSSKPDTPTVTGAKIASFTVLGAAGVIDHDAGTITVTLPFGTDITKVAPVISLAGGAVCSPVSGEVVNLANGVTYTVTNGKETKKYTVRVVLERSVSDQLWDKVAEDNTIADHQVSYDNSILSDHGHR